MSRNRLTGKRAVWLALLTTPVLVVTAVTLLGVTAGAAGPSKQATLSRSSAASGLFTTHARTQTLAQVKAFWTTARMADAAARPYPMPAPAESAKAPGSVESVPQPTGAPGGAILRAGGGADVFTSSPQAAGALTEPFHGAIPYTQFQWFGRYLRNVAAGSPNLAISAIHKMFFSQDTNGNGVIDGGENFVCSSSSIGPDTVWTAGHCTHNGLGDPTDFNGGFSTNVFFCPSYDVAQGGVNPTAGCWSDDQLAVYSVWANTGDLDIDFGAADATDNPVLGPQTGMIGNYTGWFGIAWNWGNVNWLSFGYPAAAPFAGGKIETCASSLGYSDSGGATTPDSVAMGCDMTGGSSGGPWILGFGKFPSQPGGGPALWIDGHNDWRHGGVPEELNSPYYDCRGAVLLNFISGSTIVCP